MADSMRHRGPDDSGIELVARGRKRDRPAPTVVFGHRRLAIIDVSSAGHQPMTDPGTGNWITFNGEIYNFLDLRKELEALGHSFVSRCDTEVILKGYAEWGIGLWRRLRGIFALGLWDNKYQELFLVRDHLGVKPVYFSRTVDGLFFGSEVRSLLASGCVSRKLSHAGLESYLKYGSVQEPCTIVEGVESLLAGHYLVCDSAGISTVRPYWRAEECLRRNWRQQPTVEEILSKLQDAVTRQLMADVPVGVFLSGGLDSASIAAMATRAQPGAIRTFCIGSDEAAFDEGLEAASTAKMLNCVHSTLRLEGSMVLENISRAISCYDQPSADGLNTYFISKLVREAGIKVALSGLGGDEVFVGYEGFKKALLVERLNRVLKTMPHGVRQLFGRGIAAASPPGSAVLGAFAEILNPRLAASYFASRTVFSQGHAQRLVGDATFQRTFHPWRMREETLAQVANGLTGVVRVSFLELQTYMVSTLLRDSDQMSMAHGLELRVPLIDHELVEHVLPIVQQEDIRNLRSKRLLTDVLGEIVPRHVMRRRKRGFALPFHRWFNRELKDPIAACFHRGSARGPWDRRIFERVWTDFQKNRVGWSRVLALYTLEEWLENNHVYA